MPKPYQPPPIDWHQQPLVKATTAAKLLDCTSHHIRHMIHDGRLQAVQLPTIRNYRKHRDKYRIVTASILKVLMEQVKTA